MKYIHSDKFRLGRPAPADIHSRRPAAIVFTGLVALLVSIAGAEGKNGAGSAGLLPATVPADQGSWRRNPFLGENDSKASQPAISSRSAGTTREELHLQGIMRVDSSSYAIINGRCYRSGERIREGVLLKEIGRYHVVVIWNGVKQTYNIFQGKLK